MGYPESEIQAAFDRYREAAAEAGRTGNWELFVDCFTDDVRYVEHHYGTFHGRDEVRAWVVPAMTTWPVTRMTSFPWKWFIIDAERGWVVGEVANVMDDPGNGLRYETANWTRLVYGGGGRFCEEEDVYNPNEFAQMVGAWLQAWKGRHPDG